MLWHEAKKLKKRGLLQVRHPERSEVDLLKTAWCLIRRCFRVKAKDDVPRVMTH